MIKFLGLLSKKKKVKANLASAIYVNLLNNVIEVGFLEIKDFINNNNNLEDKPSITNQHSNWFRSIVFLGNMRNLDDFFEENESRRLVIEQCPKTDKQRNTSLEDQQTKRIILATTKVLELDMQNEEVVLEGRTLSVKIPNPIHPYISNPIQTAFEANTSRPTIERLIAPLIFNQSISPLRSFQEEGVKWLIGKQRAILADDMGLGKTVQSLCWLLWLRAKSEGDPLPSLVICPKSVLDVWSGEVKKFAPEIRVQVLRSKDELDMDALKNDVDLLVLNYAQLRVGEEKLTKQEWLTVILDEGQQIKNPDSMAAKAARKLDSEHRIVLTGTPIENRLLDVWSLMAFAMPGVLGDKKYFRKINWL